MKTIVFNGVTLSIKKEKYARKGRIALQLRDEGSPYCMATVNLPDESVPDNTYTFIKNWSENAGVLEALVRGGIVEDTGVAAMTGHCYANLVKVLI